MIKLTCKSGKPIYINPDLIVETGILNDETYYVLTTISNDGYSVITESPEDVARKILEYKLTMERYRAGCNHNTYNEIQQERTLLTLAGLEVQE